jgi:hypothetical protein
LISVQGLKTEDRLLCQEEDRGGPQTAKTEYEMFISIIGKAVSEVDHQKLKLKSRNLKCEARNKRGIVTVNETETERQKHKLEQRE